MRQWVVRTRCHNRNHYCSYHKPPTHHKTGWEELIRHAHNNVSDIHTRCNGTMATHKHPSSIHTVLNVTCIYIKKMFLISTIQPLCMTGIQWQAHTQSYYITHTYVHAHPHTCAHCTSKPSQSKWTMGSLPGSSIEWNKCNDPLNNKARRIHQFQTQTDEVNVNSRRFC